MNPSYNTAFNSILGLRTEKIHNFASTMYMKQVQSFISVKFEELMENGVADLLGRIELSSGLISSCPDEEHLLFQPPIFKPTTDPNYHSFIMDHLDWSAEMLVGYRAGVSEERIDNYYHSSHNTDDTIHLYDLNPSKESSLQNYILDDDITDLDTPSIRNNNPPATHAFSGLDTWDDVYNNDYHDDGILTDDVGVLSHDEKTEKFNIAYLDEILSDFNPHNEKSSDEFEFGAENDDADFFGNDDYFSQSDTGGTDDYFSQSDTGGTDDYFSQSDTGGTDDYLRTSASNSKNDDYFSTLSDTTKEYDYDKYADLMNDYFTDIDEVASQTDDYDIKDARTGKDDNNWDELYNSISQKKDNGDEGILKDLTKRVDEMAGAVKDTFGFADWQDKYQKKPEVKHLVILAERNSGLSWLYQKISDCYPQLKVSTCV